MVKKEFFPLVDEGRFLVRFETPVGSSFEYTEQKNQRSRRKSSGKILMWIVLAWLWGRGGWQADPPSMGG